MTPREVLPPGTPQHEPLPLSLLNDFLYCSRWAALKGLEGMRGENEYTVLGDLAHEFVEKVLSLRMHLR